MAQHLNVAASVKRYTRADFTALRAKLNKLPTERIMALYYHEDDLLDMGCSTPADLDRHLAEMRDHLAARARQANPHLAELLRDARHLGRWSPGLIDYLVKSADQDMSRPQPGDTVSVWLTPRVAEALRTEGLVTLADLKRWMERRGPGWWRPIPRIGSGKARAIERWLAQQAEHLGALSLLGDEPATDLVDITRQTGRTVLVPLERMAISNGVLDGSQGVNRNHAYCLIAARNDLEAVQDYLYKFREQEKTRRAYQKELERFLLWCVCVRGIPMSSVLTAECEDYKTFLSAPDTEWIGPKTFRHARTWKPFAGTLEPQSQRYAVQVIRTFFEWLVRVRYLGGNPWVTVNDPRVAIKEEALDLDKALPRQLWEALSLEGGILDRACETPALAPSATSQYRLARAAILLMGHTGIRREEAAGATRNRLRPLPAAVCDGVPLWELSVLGKRNKWRTVFLPERAVAALKAHWADRGHDFDYGLHEIALLSPLVVPPTAQARAKHLHGAGELTGNGFSPDGLYRVVKTALLRLAEDTQISLGEEERHLLRSAAPHALRHTFATLAVAKEMPTDVLQRLLGHASSNTTSIYVRAERTRSIKEVGKFFEA